MKQIITCICLLLATGMMAQTTPTRSSEARKTNMSRTNARTAISKVTVGMTDGPASSAMTKGDFGINVSPVEGGVEIKEFTYVNSSAKAAKMLKGDIITKVNSKVISNQAELSAALAAYQPGEVVTVHYTRGIRNLTKDVRIGLK